jgi:cytochrome c553
MGILRMTKMILAALLLGLPLGGFAGEPSSRVALSPSLLQQLKQANATKGKELAATCSACHAPGSVFPVLDGQLPTYLYKQIQDYKDGHRDNAVMSGIAATLSEEDIMNVSAYFGSLPLAKSASEPLTTQPVLAFEGDGRRILPPCAACHDRQGTGQKIDIPALAGQSEAYLAQTLNEYKSGARHNDLYGRMRSIAKEMTDAEITDLARYYAGLGK